MPKPKFKSLENSAKGLLPCKCTLAQLRVSKLSYKGFIGIA